MFVVDYFLEPVLSFSLNAGANSSPPLIILSSHFDSFPPATLVEQNPSSVVRPPLVTALSAGLLTLLLGLGASFTCQAVAYFPSWGGAGVLPFLVRRKI